MVERKVSNFITANGEYKNSRRFETLNFAKKNRAN